MEKICRIVSISDIEEREVATRDGGKKKICSCKVQLYDGVDEFVAEANDDMATKLRDYPIPVGTLVSVGVRLRVVEFDAKDNKGNPTGEKRRTTFINLRDMRVMQ